MSISTTLKIYVWNRSWWSGLLSFRRIVLVLIVAFVGLASLIPLLFLLWDSFKEVSVGNLFDPSLTNFTLKNFREAYADPRSLTMLSDSLFFAFGSMAVAFFFGGTMAFLVERTNTLLRNVVYGLMFIPLVMPSMLKAIAWILLISPEIGMFNRAWLLLPFTEEALFNAYSIPAMFWVEGLSMSPLTFLMLGSALRAMDPSMEEASYTAGAGKLSTLFRITLPMMTPALAGIGLLQFVRGLEAFEVPLIMGYSSGIQVYSTNIYFAIREVTPPLYGQAFVYSLVLIILSIIGLILYQRFMGHAGQYATVTGKGYRPRLLDLGKWRGAAAAFIFLFLAFSVILPFFVLLYASFLPYYQLPSDISPDLMSMDNYRALYNRRDILLTLKNTAILCGTVSVGGMLIATVISWLVIRMRTKGSRVLDGLLFVPFAIPSIAMAFSFLILFLSIPNPIYGTIWLLVLVYLVRFLPIGTRFTHAGIAQIKVELEEAAASSGAGLLTILRRIIIPLILPSLIAGGLFMLLLSAKVMSSAAILYTPDSMVLSVMIYQLWNEGSIPLVGALSVLMILVFTIISVASRNMGQRRAMMV
ncbi:ABC transporter permease [Chloroflexota bacterium]